MFFNQMATPNHKSHANSFHLAGSFLTWPKQKGEVSKLEKELEDITSTLKTIRKELATIRSQGRKITVENAHIQGN